jgi:hypothetical protein
MRTPLLVVERLALPHGLTARVIGLGAGALLLLGLLVPAAAEPNTGGGPGTFNCTGVGPSCGSWGPKGANTCRTCQQALCKTENGKEVIAGNTPTPECYEGHGAPPARFGGKPHKGLLNNAPAAGTLKRQ